MDVKKKLLLQQHQQDILEDLDITDIQDELFARDVILQDDFDHIQGLTSRLERSRYFLDRLIQSGTNSSYEAFVDSLTKDYEWLSKKLSAENNDPMINESFEDSLSKGDVPRPPEHHVKRAVEAKVVNALKNLTRHKILVLHGMPGSGKTCVAINALRDNSDLITNNFNGEVFWMNFGNCKTDNDIVLQQNILLRKTSSSYRSSYHMNSSMSMSSIGSNIDNQSLSNYDLTSLELRDKLKSTFFEPALKEALLVLDEVNDKKCLEAFDIGCKIMITTRDTNVVANFKPEIIKIENTFKERESLELFATCLDIPVNRLPWQAKRLHELCKGSTYHIVLLGGQLAEDKERLNHDTKEWNVYLKKLERKEFLAHLLNLKSQDNLMKTIQLCINSLDDNILPLFKMLTVLPDNVKVTAKVLSKLWNKDVPKVEQIMKVLRSKSLIIEYFNREKKMYIYEIHDLIMNYLRTCTNKLDTKKLHCDLLKSYNYGDSPSLDIVDDGYIAFYIGHHIMHTDNMNNKWTLFKKLFLNLKFLGHKVKLTGPADVIYDLQKYESYIVEDSLDKDLLDNIKAYLSTHGTDLYRYPLTDVVQSILQYECKGILYSKASQIAQESSTKNELYFDFIHEQNEEEIKHSTIDVKEDSKSVGFLGDYVLVGTDSGVIKAFHIPTNKMKMELPISKTPVKWVGACPSKPRVVAALTFDGVIKLSTIHFDDISLDDNDEVIEEEPEEQCNNNPTNLLLEPKLGPFMNCRWANYEETLITHTVKMVIFYKLNGTVHQVIENFERDCEIVCCVPSNNDKYVFVSVSGSYNAVVMIDAVTKERVMTFDETDTVLDIHTVPGCHKIIAFKVNEISEHVFKFGSSSLMNSCHHSRSRKIISCRDVKDNLIFIAIAVNRAGTLLFISTDDSRVLVLDLKTGTRVAELDNRRGNVITMAVSEIFGWDEFVPGSDVLLTGTDDTENSAKVWYLDAAYISQSTHKNGKVRLTTNFDVSFLNTLSPRNLTPPKSGSETTNNTPKRNQSFPNHAEVTKRLLKNTLSLDRHSLKPLNLKGICNNNEGAIQPLLAVVDDKNNIQVIRGRKLLTEIVTDSDDQVTSVKISPCNQYIIYGLLNGEVKKYTLRTKECSIIMDVYSPVQYLRFVNSNLLMVSGKNHCVMAYRFAEGGWLPQMLQRGNTNLGSQELIDDLQGLKKLNLHPDQLSKSDSESTGSSSHDRLFPNGDVNGLCKTSELVDCFWIPDKGLLTVEYNAIIKLWDRELKMSSVLTGRQARVNITYAALQKNILVICDDNNKGFQTFELRHRKQTELHPIQEYKLDHTIVSCCLSADGNVLALGLESGTVVVWNVPGKCQIKSLNLHKGKVQFCSFSPVPSRLAKSNLSPPTIGDDNEQPPLVLVTMASEIVWWNITLIMKMRTNEAIWRSRMNVVTPLSSPLEAREPRTPTNSTDSSPNIFFFCDTHECWKALWNKKTCKEGSKRKEVLACIKLSGVNATKLCHDAQFCCFVTVDNPGHIHIMNIVKPNS